LLQLKDVTVRYGEICAVDRVSLQVSRGEAVALIGANGAGKTSILNAISGLHRPASGEILLNDVDISRLPSHKIVGSGLVLVPEGRAILGTLTVLENLQLGAYRRRPGKEVEDDLANCFSLFPRLHERQKQMADSLSGGEQQMLAIGRALMARPAIMLLDEPSMGLAPIMVKEVFQTLKRISAMGTTILLVEQNARMALTVASRAYVLERGRITLEQDSAALSRNEIVAKAYLGALQ
jgi:branched-chain amino acid transport system ATP-binding protein